LRKAKAQNQDGETRVDYIADHLGLNRKDVIRLIGMLREEGILGDAKDLTAELRSKKEKKVFEALGAYFKLERFLFKILDEERTSVNFKELNEEAFKSGIRLTSVKRLKSLVNFWAIKGWLKQRSLDSSREKAELRLIEEKKKLTGFIDKRQKLAGFILKNLMARKDDDLKFSILELKKSFETNNSLFKDTATGEEVEDALFYLSRIGAISIEGGFMVIYNRLRLERLKHDNRIRFKKEDYKKLENYYQSKTRQIHIVGEYARLHLEEYSKALQFVEDYFSLHFEDFLKKYFPAERRVELERNITPGKFEKLFGELSPRQLSIIMEKDAKRIVVAAGPGSGKTRVLAHKLASLILLEDAKHEQLLMLTFSRVAVTEFKKRLFSLVGNAANLVEIKTFHSYCFDLLGKVGNLEDSDKIIENAIKAINKGMVEKSRVTKAVLVIDEAQDISKTEFELIKTLIEANDRIRIIAVGDDDQNIFEFRGSNSRYLRELLNEEGSKKFELVENYRSCKELVELANQYVRSLDGRLKKEPLESENDSPGIVELTWCESPYLYEPIVNKILKTKSSGTSCVLTSTNEQALQIASLLQQKGLQAKLIQSNEKLKLGNLVEVRNFMDLLINTGTKILVQQDDWQKSVEIFKEKNSNSANFKAVERLIEDFQKTCGSRIFLSDFKEFVNESRLEDFIAPDESEILVSTIHKAKGKEFDTVYLMLQDFKFDTQEKRRQLYVALTRAKTRLFLITNNADLQLIIGEEFQWKLDNTNYQQPRELILNAGFKDIYLDSFKEFQNYIDGTLAGSSLIVHSKGCNNEKGQPCVRYSKSFIKKLEDLSQKGFQPEKAEAAYVFWWQKQTGKKENEEYPEIKVILPRLYLRLVL
jgi:ATP-dependent DNA helicase RecQ